MAGRSLLETAISHHLATAGWAPPSMRAQTVAFPGVTPVQPVAGAAGRAAALMDAEKRAKIAGRLVAYLAGLKASATRKTTITITTGNPKHTEAVCTAAENGLSLPIIVIAMKATISGTGSDATITDHGPISVAVINVGKSYREHGLVQRVQGQGKGRATATFTPAALSYGEKIQRSKAGKTYRYVSLAANLKSCGAEYQTLDSLDDLAQFVSENAEGFFL
jgi:hypothetical protein